MQEGAGCGLEGTLQGDVSPSVGWVWTRPSVRCLAGCGDWVVHRCVYLWKQSHSKRDGGGGQILDVLGGWSQ